MSADEGGNVEKEPKVRNFLEHNKVFFEVGSSLIFGIASLFAIIATYQFQKRDAQIADIQNSPNFYVDETYVKNEKTGKYDEKILRIINSGSDVSNYTSSVRTHIKIRQYLNNEVYDYEVPLIGYYFAHFESDEPTGVMTTSEGKDNNSKFHTVLVDLMLQEFKDTHGYVEMRPIHIIRVSYTNRLGERKHEYFRNEFKVFSIKEQQSLNRYFDFRSDDPIPLDISDMTAESIMSYVKRNLSPSKNLSRRNRL